MANVTLEQANTIIDTAIRTGHDLGLQPLTVAVLDSGGHLVAFKREDKSALLRPQIAMGKAWGCLGMGFSTRRLVDRFKSNPAFFGAISDLADGRMLASPGGVLIRDDEGEIIGAVGITGDSSENDETCAVAGIEAAGFTADAG